MPYPHLDRFDAAVRMGDHQLGFLEGPHQQFVEALADVVGHVLGPELDVKGAVAAPRHVAEPLPEGLRGEETAR